VLQRSYLELADVNPKLPEDPGVLPRLLDRVQPLHGVVPIDAYIPGCPPPADRIRAALESLRQGELPKLQGRDIKFG
jgi:NAD-reducing hydrogenase small subunit